MNEWFEWIDSFDTWVNLKHKRFKFYLYFTLILPFLRDKG